MKFRYGDPVPSDEPDQFVPPPLYCLHCAYDLRGLRSGRCSECGTLFVYDNWLREVTRIGSNLPETERIVCRASRSWQISLAAFFLHLAGLATSFGALFDCAARAAEFGGATAGMVFAVRGLQSLRLPLWAQERLSVRLNPVEAWAGILGCVLVYALLILT